MWKCRKCKQERARRQNTECEKGGEHDWGDRDEVNAELEQEAELRRLEAEERRQEAEFKYLTFLNSAAGQERLTEIANGYLARRKTASIVSLISGVITIITFVIGCVVFVKVVINTVNGSFLKNFQYVALLITIICVSFEVFRRFWKKRSELSRRVRDKKTGRAVPIMDAAKFLASYDISQDFEYKDKNGDSCTPDTVAP